MLWVRISIRARCTTLCDKICQWLATGRWFSPGPPVSSTNKTDRHDIAEILLKVALRTTKQQTTNNNKLIISASQLFISALPFADFHQEDQYNISVARSNQQHPRLTPEYRFCIHCLSCPRHSHVEKGHKYLCCLRSIVSDMSCRHLHNKHWNNR
jgi:hypothetical protein